MNEEPQEQNMGQMKEQLDELVINVRNEAIVQTANENPSSPRSVILRKRTIAPAVARANNGIVILQRSATLELKPGILCEPPG